MDPPDSAYWSWRSYGIACPSANKCFAVGAGGSAGIVLSTTNGGTTWIPQTLPGVP